MSRSAPPPSPDETRLRDLRGQGELIQHYGVLFNLVEGLYHYMLNYPLADIERAGLDVGPSQQIGRPPRLPAERFMAEWQAGALAVPLQACTGAQLYRAFLRRWINSSLTIEDLSKSFRLSTLYLKHANICQSPMF